MNRKDTTSRPLNGLINPSEYEPGTGGQIDWSRVGEYFLQGKFTVKVNGAVAKNAEAITVDALEHPLKANTTLDFGEEKEVTFIVDAAGAAQNATSIPLTTGLSGPIPSGAEFHFNSGEFARLTANAAAGATSLTVEALPNALESGDTATYQGGRKLAELQEDAAKDATTLVVQPLQFAIADNAEATADYTGTNDERKLPALTVMARTADGKLIPRRDAVVGDGETAIELLASDAYEKSKVAAKSGYGTVRSSGVYENLLPDADEDGNIPSLWKTEFAANGSRFWFEDYYDSSVS